MPKSDLEASFSTIWRQLGFPDVWLPEFRFDDVRRFRLDFADPVSKVGVELDGGTWSGGRHTRGYGFESDCVKGNLAISRGWVVFHLTTRMLAADPAGHLALIARTIKGRTS